MKMIKEFSDIGYNPNIYLRYDVIEDEISVENICRKRLNISYEMLKKAKFQGEILCNGSIAFTNKICHCGDVLEVKIDEDKDYPCRSFPMPLDVVYEDENILVINKPAPLPTVLGLTDTCNTLPNVLMHYFKEPEHFIYRPLNRLDCGTSGLMLIAKNAYIQSYLQSKLHTDEFYREYVALVEGFNMPESGLIDLPIARLSTNSWGIHEKGKPSQTLYRLNKKNERFALCNINLLTGRTHQIRLHFSYNHAPVVGDYVYGVEDSRLPKRFALHSHMIRVKLPYKDEVSEFIAPIPKVFEEIYDSET